MPTSEEIGRVETAKAEAALPGCHPRERCTRPEGRVVLTFSDSRRGVLPKGSTVKMETPEGEPPEVVCTASLGHGRVVLKFSDGGENETPLWDATTRKDGWCALPCVNMMSCSNSVAEGRPML